MNNIISINSDDLDGFNNIWKKLLKQKVRIVYEIANDKKYDFNKLLEEVCPEAIKNRDLWENDFIINVAGVF